MLICYLIALVPVAIGGVLWMKSKEVVWWEWLAGTAIGFAVAGIFHFAAVASLAPDTEIWSGRVQEAVHVPRWVEKYKKAVYETKSYRDSNGKTRTRQVFSHYETRYRTHGEHWYVDTTLGKFRASQGDYKRIVGLFGKEDSRPGSRPGYHSGDLNDYFSVNVSGWLEPVHDARSWHNRVKASKSLFDFAPPPNGSFVYEYPEVTDIFRSDRMLGAKPVPQTMWDQMCARLGPRKKVNVILCHFGMRGSKHGHWQQAHWIGGKKNDLVICYGGSHEAPEWAYVFGWTDKEIVKKRLESLVLESGVTVESLPKIEEVIRDDYVIKNWDDFDYLSVRPPWWSYIVLVVIMAGAQFAFWYFATENEYSKAPRGLRPHWMRRRTW